VGRPSVEARGVYQAVQQAQQAAVDVVKPGIKAGKIDHIARKSLQNSGLAKYFTHSTGHGVGLESTRRRAWLPDSLRSCYQGW